MKQKSEWIFPIKGRKDAAHAYIFNCEIEHFWVAPEYRRKGLGKKMLKEVEKIACKRGCKELVAWLPKTTYEEVKGFWLKMGYKPIPSFRYFPRMKKKLKC